MENCTPDDVTRIDPNTGQWQGMRIHSTRHVIAILHELLEAIASAANAKLLAEPVFAATIRRSDPSTQRAWNDLVAVATGQGGSSAFREYLGRVRNRAAFHYDRARLWEGYEYHFAKRPSDDFNSRAYMSLGKTMKRSRFYFADAAASCAYVLFDPSGQKIDEANDHVVAMNRALRNIVEAYNSRACGHSVGRASVEAHGQSSQARRHLVDSVLPEWPHYRNGRRFEESARAERTSPGCVATPGPPPCLPLWRRPWFHRHGPAHRAHPMSDPPPH